jgi:uncharacterized membrane protein (UPF0127 family)
MPTNGKRRQRWFRETFGLACILIFVCAGFYFFQDYLEAKSRIFGHFQLEDSKRSSELRMELANDDRERSRGLMYRKPGSMKEDEGMLFAFPGMSQRKFWMANTYLPLDMIFLDHEWKIVGVLEDVPALSRQQRFVDAESQYVIELLSGSAKRLGLKNGAHFVVTRGDITAE